MIDYAQRLTAALVAVAKNGNCTSHQKIMTNHFNVSPDSRGRAMFSVNGRKYSRRDFESFMGVNLLEEGDVVSKSFVTQWESDAKTPTRRFIAAIVRVAAHIVTRDDYPLEVSSQQRLLDRDVMLYGTSFSKDGKRIDPRDVLIVSHGLDPKVAMQACEPVEMTFCDERFAYMSPAAMVDYRNLSFHDWLREPEYAEELKKYRSMRHGLKSAKKAVGYRDAILNEMVRIDGWSCEYRPSYAKMKRAKRFAKLYSRMCK